MNLLTILLITATYISLENAIVIFNLNRRSSLNIVYSLFTLDFSINFFLLYAIKSSPDIQTCQFWYFILIPFGCFLPTLPLHFSLILSGNRLAKNRLFLFLIYLPPVLFCYFMMKTGYFSPEFIMTPWGYDIFINFFKNRSYIFIIYFSIHLITSAVMIAKWRYTTTTKIEQQQAKVILLPFISGVIGIILCPNFWHFESNPYLNALIDVTSFCAIIYFLLGIRYAVRKYHFMDVTPNTNLGLLIEGFIGPVFVIKTDGSVICRNREADLLIDALQTSGVFSFTDTFNCNGQLAAILNNISHGSMERIKFKFRFNTGKTGNSYLLDIQPIANFENRAAGILVMINKDLSVSEFKQQFKITDRQMDIILMAAAGSSNREIAEKLNIVEKTIENHLFNIYNKLSVNNKIELYNLVQKHNVISEL